MKYSIIILALAAVMFQTFSKAIIFINYELNKEYISKNLCENRNKPQMHCCGKCQLKKQLAAEDNNEKAPPFQNMKDKVEVQLFCTDCNIAVPFNRDAIIFSSPSSSNHYFGPESTAIFHPPRA